MRMKTWLPSVTDLKINESFVVFYGSIIHQYRIPSQKLAYWRYVFFTNFNMCITAYVNFK